VDLLRNLSLWLLISLTKLAALHKLLRFLRGRAVKMERITTLFFKNGSNRIAPGKRPLPECGIGQILIVR
jgi:hypothetical protein